MSWQLLLYINLAAGTIRELLNKKISNTVSLFAGLFYITLFAQLFFYVSWVFTSQKLPRYDLYASLSGILIVAGFSFYFAALRISLTQSILFQSYSILITILLSAVFLGESKYFDIRTFTGIKVVSGTILAFLALWYLLHQKNKKEERLEKKCWPLPFLMHWCQPLPQLPFIKDCCLCRWRNFTRCNNCHWSY